MNAYPKFFVINRRCFILGAATILASGCHQTRASENYRLGANIVYGSLISGRSISVKSALIPNGRAFANPGALTGGIKGKKSWRSVPTKTMVFSGDLHEQLPEWAEFRWTEPPYPEDPDMSLESYRALPQKTQRIFIRSRIPADVIAEVSSAKEKSRGALANKGLWLYFFWTPEGIRMRWSMRDAVRGNGGFGPVLKEGGDDFDCCPQ